MYFEIDLKRYQFPTEKWSEKRQESVFFRSKLHPMWIADMEFMTVPQVITDIRNRAVYGHFGYEVKNDDLMESFVNWQSRIHDWHINKSNLLLSPSASTALAVVIEMLTEIDDSVVIQPPVYHNFAQTIKKLNRRVIKNSLILRDKYEMNLKELENIFKSNSVRLMIIANPHNPVGRVWSKSELSDLADLCNEYGILLVSDELHRDILYSSTKMIPISDFYEDTIVLMSPGKTFNISGQSHTVIYSRNKGLLADIKTFHDKFHLNHSNVLSNVAFESAYQNGEKWFSDFISYLTKNLQLLNDFIMRELPSVSVVQPEGTYLVWLDLRKYSTDPKFLLDRLVNCGELAIDSGHWYGREGAGFIRLNIACPKEHLLEGLIRLKKALICI